LKKSDLLIKVVILVVFVAMVAYIGYSVYETRDNPLVTVAAVAWDVTDSYATEGHIVRNEQTLAYAGGNVYVSAAEGQKVAAGEAVAVSYSGEGALERAEDMREVRLEIEELKAIRDDKSRDDLRAAGVRDLARAVADGDLEDAEAAKLAVKVNIFSNAGRYTDSELTARITALENELARLMNGAGAGMREVAAATAGTFSAAVDGYEAVAPEDVMGITPEAYERLFAAPEKVGAAQYGKLISGIRWYYVTVIGSDCAKRLKEGAKATLDFSRTYNESLEMTVEKLGPMQDGRCVAVFSCRKNLQDITAVREATADVVFERMSGVRVPKEAVHLDEDGNAYLYVLLGMQAARAAIEVVTESGDYYLVAPQDGALGPGSQIIVRANGLADGKVVTE